MGPPRSKVWDHFTRLNADSALCTKCGETRVCKGGSTKGLINHLQTHKISIIDDNEDLSTSEPPKKVQKTATTPSVFQYLQRESLPEIISKFAAVDGFSLHAIVNSEGISCHIKSRNYNPPKSASTAAALINEFHIEVESETIQELGALMDEGERLSVSVDDWTDCQMRKFKNVTVHTRKKNFILGLTRVIGSSNAEDTAKKVKEVLIHFKIDPEKHLVASCNDGAAVMVKYGKLIEALCQLCYNHAIHNSVVEVFFKKKDQKEVDYEIEEDTDDYSFEEDEEESYDDAFYDILDVDSFEPVDDIKDTLKETRKIVSFFRKSSIRKDILTKNTKEEFGKSLNLILDCKTRWSSTLNMVQRFVKIEKSLNKSLLELGQPQVSESHFKSLREIYDVLHPAKMVITELSKDDSTLLTAEGSINFLFEKLDSNKSPLASKLKATLEEKLLNRRNKPLVSLLYFLHNGFYAKKSTYLEYSSKEEVKSFAESIYGRLFPVENVQPEEETQSTTSVEPQTDAELLKLSINNVLEPKRTIKSKSIKTEMNSFENIGGHRSDRLEKLFNALLTIKPTSTSSERVFSIAGSICSKIRNRMSDQLLSQLVFLRYYFLNRKKNVKK